MTASSSSSTTQTTERQDDEIDGFKNDLGKYIGKPSELTDEKKMELLTDRWVPPKSYDFSKDSNDSKRRFLHEWLHTYQPWLTYSKELKGALCLFCVLFPPINPQGVIGSFIVTPFQKYKNLHQACKNHAASKWHQTSTMSAKQFKQSVPVNVQMISGHEKMIEQNRKVISSIISSIMFCGTHDIPLRGKTHDAGNLLEMNNLFSTLECTYCHLTLCDFESFSHNQVISWTYLGLELNAAMKCSKII